MALPEPIRVADIRVHEGNYIQITLRQMWEELPFLLAGALLVSLPGVPCTVWAQRGAFLPASLVGIGLLAPLWVAYCHTLGRVSLGEKPSFEGLFSSSRHSFWRSVAVAAPFGIFWPVVMSFAPGLRLALPLPVTVGIALQGITLIVLGLLTLSALPLLALFDLKLSQSWQNSLYLLARWPVVSTGLASLLVLLFFASGWLGLVSWPLIPLLYGPFAVNAVLLLVHKTAGVGPAH